MLLTIAIVFDWQFGSLDVSTAFLQSEKLDRAVFVVPPSTWFETDEGKSARKKLGPYLVWKLLRPL